MLIGICGLIGSGKDTTAQYLVDSRGFDRISMATPLKDATAILFGWDRAMLEGATPETRKMREEPDQFWTERLGREWSPRIALQYLGTDLFRDNLHESVWVYATERKIRDAYLKRLGEYEKLDQKTPDIVISDIRFPNEIKMIRDMGGEIWWVRRGQLPDWWIPARVTCLRHRFNPSNEVIKEFQKEYGAHYSEWAWAGTEFDLILDNDTTLADLYQKVEKRMTNG